MGLKNVVEKVPGYNRLVLPVHYVQAFRAGMKYKWPAKNLRVIGVTGTNGKTTTCFMIWKMLLESGRKAGLLTTVGWSENGEKLHRQYEHMTTERVEILNQRMRAIADAGAEFLVLEVTSHALVQYRTLGVPIEIAVFTNLTHEHLDYHKTFENYRKAKLKLFRQAKFGVVNADDGSAKYFAGVASPASSRPDGERDVYASGDIMTYGIEHGEVRATEIELKPTGVSYACGDIASAGSADGSGRVLRIETQIPGKFNVYNSLAAVCVGKRLGLTDEEIERGVYALESVEGRMNRINEGQEFEVIVDYAHTPDALEKVFESVVGSSRDVLGRDASAFGGRVISVHGGAGRRDESTRSMRGEILGKYSDIVIITEDDSRDEDPEKIAAQFVEGAEKAGKVKDKDLYIELDRRKAIEKALGMARAGDIVLVLGKGHEKTILRADGAHEFEDVKVVKEELKRMRA